MIFMEIKILVFHNFQVCDVVCFLCLKILNKF